MTGSVETEVQLPTSTLTLVEPHGQSTRTGMLIAPGGGYESVAADYEGMEPARWLAARGVTAAILKYRVAPHQHPAQLEDARQAFGWLRHRVGSDRVGVWGFSAGAHLAGLLATEPHDRPRVLVMAYPVVSMVAEDAHLASRRNLLGSAETSMAASVSLELRVDEAVPPTFLLHTHADVTVSPTNSVRFYQALLAAGVSTELHIYADGPHGIGMGNDATGTETWPHLLDVWLGRHGMRLLP